MVGNLSWIALGHIHNMWFFFFPTRFNVNSAHDMFGSLQLPRKFPIFSKSLPFECLHSFYFLFFFPVLNMLLSIFRYSLNCLKYKVFFQWQKYILFACTLFKFFKFWRPAQFLPNSHILCFWVCLFFFNWNIVDYNMLVSDVRHTGLTFAYFMKWSPWQV